MKTVVIQLEPSDDLTSVRDKMDWSKAERLLLVWPSAGRIIKNEVELGLIQRKSRELGAQLAIVTYDRLAIKHANRLRINVFNSVSSANRKGWKPNPADREIKRGTMAAKIAVVSKSAELLAIRRRPSGQITRLASFGIGVLSIAALAFFFLPSAKITLTPRKEIQTMELSLRGSPEITVPNLTGGIPVVSKIVTVSGQMEGPTTGGVLIPEKKASGILKIKNLSKQSVVLPEDSIFLDPNIPDNGFVIAKRQPVSIGSSRTVDVDIQAINPGGRGNVPAGTISAMTGSVGAQLRIENINPTSGGSEQRFPSASQSDYDTIKARLVNSLKNSAVQQINSSMKSQEPTIPSSVIITKILKEERTPEDGQPSDRLKLSMEVEASGWGVDPRDEETIMRLGMDAALPVGYSADDGRIEVEQKTAPTYDAVTRELYWSISANRMIAASWSTEDVIQNARGKIPDSAIKYLASNTDLEKEPKISLSPSWWPVIPYLSFRIEVAED